MPAPLRIRQQSELQAYRSATDSLHEICSKQPDGGNLNLEAVASFWAPLEAIRF